MMRSNRQVSFSGGMVVVLTVLLPVLVLVTSGCARPGEISDSYGTLTTFDSRSSINGTSVLADVIRQNGNQVVTGGRITPRIERFGAVVWFAAKDSGCPDPDVSQRISHWLENDRARKLIYVGWDADTSVEFWSDAVITSSGGADARALLRRRARAMAEQENIGEGLEASTVSCDWFRIEKGPRQELDRLVGQDGRVFDVSGGDVELGAVRLMPRTRLAGSAILKTDNDVPFAYSTFSSPSAEWHNVYVVSNSSFLLNYSLLKPANRELASALLDEVGGLEGPVLFLHSGHISWSDAIYEKQTAWSWINQPPVRTIVPHVLVIGLLFIFSVFPVLGRPKAVENGLQPGLGRHVDAVGQLIVRSGKTSETEYWLKSKSSLNQDSQNPAPVNRKNRRP